MAQTFYEAIGAPLCSGRSAAWLRYAHQQTSLLLFYGSFAKMLGNVSDDNTRTEEQRCF